MIEVIIWTFVMIAANIDSPTQSQIEESALFPTAAQCEMGRSTWERRATKLREYRAKPCQRRVVGWIDLGPTTVSLCYSAPGGWICSDQKVQP